ncbi:hypothetical protein [Vannielia litorea]|uniref:hypothetical protein n=1 Tax=Vannielia litorea TaxID=1217970 RepID=UPI001FD4EE2E|nr:hypothetical protein [Vannielia litorea]
MSLRPDRRHDLRQPRRERVRIARHRCPERHTALPCPPEVSGSHVLGERVQQANDLLSLLEAERRTGPAPEAPDLPPAVTNPDDFLDEPFDPKSFHASIRLFPFGFDFKSMDRN